MTTSVVISACQATEKKVEIVITDNDKIIEKIVLHPGEIKTQYVRDNLKISIKEVLKENEIRIE